MLHALVYVTHIWFIMNPNVTFIEWDEYKSTVCEGRDLLSFLWGGVANEALKAPLFSQPPAGSEPIGLITL